MTTALILSEWIGREVWWHVVPPDRRSRSIEDQDVVIQARVLDVRTAYGRLDFKVQPVHGSGEAWVSSKYVDRRPDAL